MKNVDNRLAVLIDADNVSDKYISEIIYEVSKYGTPTYKRIYGDWTKPNKARWKNLLLRHSITPIQQYSYTTGKNSTDSSLIIDAMDILYTDKVEGFCIVSSDSDFTRLASRLREAGMFVLGMGEKKTPSAFISACQKFIYLEVLNGRTEKELSDTDDLAGDENPVKEKMLSENDLKQVVTKLIIDKSDDGEYVFLGELGNLISKRYPDFDVRNYGYNKLTPLLLSLNAFEIKDVPTQNPNVIHKYIRIKE